MNHKRKKPKHQRAGCIFCKPHKDERRGKIAKVSDERRMIDDDQPAGGKRGRRFDWRTVDGGIHCQ